MRVGMSADRGDAVGERSQVRLVGPLVVVFVWRVVVCAIVEG